MLAVKSAHAQDSPLLEIFIFPDIALVLCNEIKLFLLGLDSTPGHRTQYNQVVIYAVLVRLLLLRRDMITEATLIRDI